MKTYLFVLALSGFTMLTVVAQDERKLRNDHTYSTHNYKHPNKAAMARQWEAKQGIGVNTPGVNRGPVASYKHPVPGAVPVGGIVVTHIPQPDVVRRNYKDQRVSLPRPASQLDTDVTDKAQLQPVLDGN